MRRTIDEWVRESNTKHMVKMKKESCSIIYWFEEKRSENDFEHWTRKKKKKKKMAAKQKDERKSFTLQIFFIPENLSKKKIKCIWNIINSLIFSCEIFFYVSLMSESMVTSSKHCAIIHMT